MKCGKRSSATSQNETMVTSSLNPRVGVRTHGNLTHTLGGLLYNLNTGPDDVYIAYLPLAHVLELLSECTMILLGVPVGYSSPNTMTDMSTAIKKGQKGDATLLRPTIMCTVPLILDRIYKNLTGAVNKKGAGFYIRSAKAFLQGRFGVVCGNRINEVSSVPSTHLLESSC